MKGFAAGCRTAVLAAAFLAAVMGQAAPAAAAPEKAVPLQASLEPRGSEEAGPEKGDSVAIPAIRLLDGEQRPAGFYKGKPLILEFWASWCPFCARQNVFLQELWEEAEAQGLEILAISTDREEEVARRHIEEKGYSFPVAMQTKELLEVFGGARVIPKVFVIEADGTLAEVIPGQMAREDLLDLIKYAPQ